ncbi:MAG: hypothetical protein ABSG26_07205 [Bryobacteraceae bacterium]|jgi:hypothetical protein
MNPACAGEPESSAVAPHDGLREGPVELALEAGQGNRAVDHGHPGGGMAE